MVLYGFDMWSCALN